MVLSKWGTEWYIFLTTFGIIKWYEMYLQDMMPISLLPPFAPRSGPLWHLFLTSTCSSSHPPPVCLFPFIRSNPLLILSCIWHASPTLAQFPHPIIHHFMPLRPTPISLFLATIPTISFCFSISKLLSTVTWPHLAMIMPLPNSPSPPCCYVSHSIVFYAQTLSTKTHPQHLNTSSPLVHALLDTHCPLPTWLHSPQHFTSPQPCLVSNPMPLHRAHNPWNTTLWCSPMQCLMAQYVPPSLSPNCYQTICPDDTHNQHYFIVSKVHSTPQCLPQCLQFQYSPPNDGDLLHTNCH